MYKLLKGKGSSANVIVQNSITNSSVIVGHLSREILNSMFEDPHCTVPDDRTEEWNIDITEELATELTSLALGIARPKRAKVKTIEKPESSTSSDSCSHSNSESVDAFDLIFGEI